MSIAIRSVRDKHQESSTGILQRPFVPCGGSGGARLKFLVEVSRRRMAPHHEEMVFLDEEML